MIEFRFSRIPDQEPACGFDLGHMEVTGKFGRGSSTEEARDQAMMIFVALADLLYGIQKLTETQEGVFDFVGADSSFSLKFRTKAGRIRTYVGRRKIDESDAVDVVLAVWKATQDLVVQELENLPDYDAGRRDLAAAVSNYSLLVEREKEGAEISVSPNP